MSRSCRTFVVAALALPIAACASSHSARGAEPTPTVAARAQPTTGERVARETVRDTALDRRIARLEMRLLEKDAQIDDLEARLDNARGEVVRALARLQSVANRAEAASGIAEAEIALQTLKTAARGQRAPEIAPMAALVKQGSTEFDKRNYGGALYLVGQAKALAAIAHGRLAAGDRAPARPGETAFALSIRLTSVSRGNVRSGPGAQFPIVFTIDGRASLTGYSYADDWIRVSDDSGRIGWINRSLVVLR